MMSNRAARILGMCEIYLSCQSEAVEVEEEEENRMSWFIAYLYR